MMIVMMMMIVPGVLHIPREHVAIVLPVFDRLLLAVLAHLFVRREVVALVGRWINMSLPGGAPRGCGTRSRWALAIDAPCERTDPGAGLVTEEQGSALVV